LSTVLTKKTRIRVFGKDIWKANIDGNATLQALRELNETVAVVKIDSRYQGGRDDDFA